MAEIFKMPKLGMDMEEGVIGAWRKAEGETVQKGEILAEIETDKSVVEVEATVSGTVLKLYYPEGETLACGTPIAFIGQPGDAIPDPAANAAPTTESAPAAAAATAPTAPTNDKVFRMPKLGMDMEEGIIGAWRKAEGETVQKGEILAEIETDKSVVEVESTVSGTVLKLYHPEGEALECGTPIAYIGAPGEAVPDPASICAAADAPAAAPAPTVANTVATAQDERFFLMPKLGMDMEEGVVGAWRKAEGETVRKGEIIAEIETDKSVVEVESAVSGTLLKIFCEEGNPVPCGTPIAFIGQPGDTIPDPSAPVVQPEAPAATPVAPASTDAPVVSKATGGRVIASPRARRAAANNEVDLSQVAGTGENGRIVEQDVLDYISNCAFQPAAKTRVAKDEIVPISGMRKIIASRMRQSQQEMAQTNTRMDVDMSNMIAFRKQINDRLADQGIKVSYVDLLVAICAKALVEHPLANASWEADGIHYKNYANIGIAVDSQKGLVVPVIKDADILSIPDISKQSKLLINKAREGSLRPDDMKGGTFTISNLGMFEVDSFTAIVNPPETCILAVGRIADRAVVVDGQIVARPMMNLCLSYDHRIIDGAPSARFLQCVKHYIENPVWLLLG